ncbi:MAG TPA: DsbA family protein [Allosphingosinicella sp.]|nr:DsbA family protein [Allosphingosinicella sp.]
MIGRKTAAAGLIGIAIGGAAMALATGSGLNDPGKDRVEKIVREYVLANPEIIPEAMERLQEREVAKVVDANRAAFETPFASAWAGAEKGDLVLVEFFDYACGFCRKSNPDVERLLRENKDLKVVWRELPVLGPDSVAAAQASLAAARQGKFRQFHDRLFEEGRPSPTAIADARRAVGVQAAPGSPEISAEIEKNHELARAIGASGTPTFVIGNQVLRGAVGYQALKEAIGAARAAS